MAVAHPLAPPADSAEMDAWQDVCAALVRLEAADADAGLVAAADVAYALDESLAHAAVVVLERGSLREVERRTWTGPPPHPYERGCFSLREAACLMPALEALATRPVVLVIDGHGIAHPRRFGLAGHLGVLFDLPAMGCAKQPLATDTRIPEPLRQAHHLSITLRGANDSRGDDNHSSS